MTPRAAPPRGPSRSCRAGPGVPSPGAARPDRSPRTRSGTGMRTSASNFLGTILCVPRARARGSLQDLERLARGDDDRAELGLASERHVSSTILQDSAAGRWWWWWGRRVTVSAGGSHGKWHGAKQSADWRCQRGQRNWIRECRFARQADPCRADRAPRAPPHRCRPWAGIGGSSPRPPWLTSDADVGLELPWHHPVPGRARNQSQGAAEATTCVSLSHVSSRAGRASLRVVETAKPAPPPGEVCRLQRGRPCPS